MQDKEFFDVEDTEETPDIELPHRKESPYHKKQRDYKHEARSLSSGNRGYRKALKLLPHLERRSYRRALDAATKEAGRDEDAELTSADKLKTYKRSMFSRLVDRKTVPLKEAIKARKESREARSNRKQVTG
ncbi:MAG: hypothetical protein J0I20_06970 [Chloroflexi bacterium]|nr:hypothetical protein [Chloroflexota bacterium]OJV95171.1 MAG: hypothetical protein BGO39_24470 [Chloroflexi bacterium 54-19]